MLHILEDFKNCISCVILSENLKTELTEFLKPELGLKQTNHKAMNVS